YGLARGDARPDPGPEGSRRPDRHRPAVLRRDRSRTDGAFGRGTAADRAATPAPVFLLAGDQTGNGHRDLRRDDRAARTSLRGRGAADQARLAWTRVLPAGPDGTPQSDVPDLEVPDDGPGRRRAQERGRPPEQAPRRGRTHVQDPRGPAYDTPRARPAQDVD